MKTSPGILWQYIRYFFFIGINWNFPLAIFMIRHEIRGEKKYRLQTTGTDNLVKSVSEKDRKHASIYQPINYYIAEILFEQLHASQKQTGFLDAGCGKGRAMALALYFGFKKVSGFDISPEMCYDALNNLEALENKYPTAILDVDCEDAGKCSIDPDTGVIFLFNPFDEVIMKPFIQQVMKSLSIFPRPMTILYANPQCKNLWLQAGFQETFHTKKMNWLEGSVLEFSSDNSKE